jgi:hypothetical protein
VNSQHGTSADGQPPAGGRRPADSDGRAVTIAAYVALLVLGAVQALIGTFQYSRGPGPLVAICFDVAIFVTCMLGSRGMRTALGGVLPAVGWLLLTLVLSTAPAGGSVLVTATVAGEWFLFGGALSAVAGAVYAFARWSRPRRRKSGLE